MTVELGEPSLGVWCIVQDDGLYISDFRISKSVEMRIAEILESVTAVKGLPGVKSIAGCGV